MPLNDLRQRVTAYSNTHNGMLYSPIQHPDYAAFKAVHGPERLQMIEPHVPKDAKTLLDIGAHWGYWSHAFEQMGLEVTAVESDPEAAGFMRDIRELTGSRFKVIEASILDLGDLGHFNIVLALNIFHHFLKKKARYDAFVEFLRNLDCDTMFFQSHDPGEGQMRGSYKNFNPDEFSTFLLDNTKLSARSEIGAIGKRPIYILTR